MKNLLPILALLLLVSCTSELDRCVEANSGMTGLDATDIDNFDILKVQFMAGPLTGEVNRGTFYQCMSTQTPVLVYQDATSIVNRDLHNATMDGNRDETDRLHTLLFEMNEEHAEEVRESWDYCARRYIKDAKKICFDQGIY